VALEYEARSDAELLRRSGRDPEAFGVFYDRHAATVLSGLDSLDLAFSPPDGARGRPSRTCPYLP
jgi:hypothetical protein